MTNDRIYCLTKKVRGKKMWFFGNCQWSINKKIAFKLYFHEAQYLSKKYDAKVEVIDLDLEDVLQ
jgi:hypothetical protein